MKSCRLGLASVSRRAAGLLGTIHRTVSNERGETAVEYALIVSMAVFCLTALGGTANYGNSFSEVAEAIDTANQDGFFAPDFVGDSNSDDPGMTPSQDGGGTKGFFTEAEPIEGSSPESNPGSAVGGDVGVPG